MCQQNSINNQEYYPSMPEPTHEIFHPVTTLAFQLRMNLIELAQNIKHNPRMQESWRIMMPCELIDFLLSIADQKYPATPEQVDKYFDFLEHDPRDDSEQARRVARQMFVVA